MSDLTPDVLADLRAELGAPRLPGMLIEVEPDDLAALLDAADERDRLARWKAEALPVMSGLQDLGRALGIGLGQRITGPEAVAAAKGLADERDRFKAEVERLRHPPEVVVRAAAELAASSWVSFKEAHAALTTSEVATRRARLARAEAEQVESLDDFYRLPAGTIVHKTWPYQGEGAEPEVWQRVGSGNWWREISDPRGWEERCAPNVAWSEGAIHVVVWRAALADPEAGEDS